MNNFFHKAHEEITSLLYYFITLSPFLPSTPLRGLEVQQVVTFVIN